MNQQSIERGRSTFNMGRPVEKQKKLTEYEPIRTKNDIMSLKDTAKRFNSKQFVHQII
jgi:hypothetical protein